MYNHPRDRYPVYAHTNETGVGEELLDEHVARCRKYYEKLKKSKKIGEILTRFWKCFDLIPESTAWRLAEEVFEGIVGYHDEGKINPAFQKEVMKNPALKKVRLDDCGDPGHSMLSSVLYLDAFLGKIQEKTELTKEEKRVLRRLIWDGAFVISRHHSDLTGMDNYQRSITTEKGYRWIQRLENEAILEEPLQVLGTQKIAGLLNDYKRSMKKGSRRQDIAFYFYCRLSFSLLVACDYYATTEYGSGVEMTDFGNADYWEFQNLYEQTKVMQSIRAYEKERYGKGTWRDAEDINELRCEIFLDAEKSLEEAKENIFFVEGPTGCGKSNLAFNLGFHLLKKGNKLQYIYPFNTLVEQNKETLAKIFDQPEVARQIVTVNSITPIRGKEDFENNPKEYYQRALLDRQFYNYPFVLSTHVSFFASLFGDRKEDAMGFHQLVGSVVIMDELQSYRNAIWAEIMIFLDVCAELLDMKIVMMSATLPGIETLAGQECRVRRLIPDAGKYFRHPKFAERVEMSYELLDEKMDLSRLAEHVTANRKKKVLITFIKKDSAYEFYEHLCRMDLGSAKVWCITGDDSMYDRERVLKPIREGKEDTVFLVSTQVVEAGVDIDMDVGYKDISKLDSEEQFAGRINRSCRRSGKVYFFNMDPARGIYRDDYRIDPDLTLENEKMRQILIQKNFAVYYDQVMARLKAKRCESTGEEGLEAFFSESVKRLNFSAVSKRMELISKDTWHMSVVLCRRLIMENGEIWDGREVWEKYKELLADMKMPYEEKQVKLSEVRSKLNGFIYQIKKNPNLTYHDMLGELICLYNGEDFFENGKLNKKKLEGEGLLFLE